MILEYKAWWFADQGKYSCVFFFQILCKRKKKQFALDVSD